MNSQSLSSGKGKAIQPPHRVSRANRSEQAGTKMPVGRIGKFMKQGKHAERIGAGAPVYMAGLLEYHMFSTITGTCVKS